MSQRESQRGLGRTVVRMKGGSARRKRIGFERLTTFIGSPPREGTKRPARRPATGAITSDRNRVADLAVSAVGVAVWAGNASGSLALRLTHIPTEVADGVSFRAHEGGHGRRHTKGQASRQAQSRERSASRGGHREQAAGPVSRE